MSIGDAKSTCSRKDKQPDYTRTSNTHKIKKSQIQISKSQEKTKNDKASSLEIDELFSKKKPALPPKAAPLPSTPREQDEISDTRGTRSKPRALTKDGLPIYTAQEMRVGTGGGTPECPFDCNCCF